MKNQDIENNLLNDFKEFIECGSSPVPKEISESILKNTFRILNPSPWLVFAKIFSIQLLTGLILLAICNQFGINPFQTNFSLSDYFMKLGHNTCMFLCGFIFIGFGMCVGRIILRKEEFRVLQNHFGLQIFALSLLSLGAFLAVGAEITLLIGLLWFLGAILGGTFTVFISGFQNQHLA